MTKSIGFYSAAEFYNQIEVYMSGGMSYEEAHSCVCYNECKDAHDWEQYVRDTDSMDYAG